jgi:type VI secretion system secreted protein VgrG
MDEQRNLSVTIASEDALDVRRFEITERISTLFSVVLEVVSPDPDLDFEAAIGLPARFSIKAGAGVARARTWSGVCAELHQIAVEESGLSTYELTIVPSLWLATQRRNHRMFQGKSEVDIVLQLLDEWGVDPVERLTGTYKKRKVRVQYGESDFAFLCRMLEDAGVSFHFDDSEGESRLVLSDAPHAATPRDPRIPFRDSPSVADREHVTRVRVSRRVRPGAVTVRDHDYRRPPAYRLLGNARVAGVEERLERFHYEPGASLFESDGGDPTPNADDRGRFRTDERDATAIAERRLHADRGEATICTFETNAIDLSPGVVMGMSGHPRREIGDEEQLLVIASTLRGTTLAEWSHACTAHRCKTPYRPPQQTPKPRVTGVESATVVGPEGEEIHTDEFGRVRVHFHWDRESRMDDKSSVWIHVSQPWSGAGFGGVNLPRVGQEVIVDFLGGDPDRPVITGRVYTNLQKVPYRLPDNKTQSGWRSNSTPKAEGFNEILFEDLAGREVVYEQAQRNRRRLVKNDEVITVNQNRQKLVRANETEQTDLDRTEVTGVNRTELTGANRTVVIGGDRNQLVRGHEQEESLGSLRRTVGGSMDLVVDGSLRERAPSRDNVVAGDVREHVGKSVSRVVKEDENVKIDGDLGIDVRGRIHIKAGTTLVVEAGADFTIKGPAGWLRVNDEGITMKGSIVKINSGGTPGKGQEIVVDDAVAASRAEIEEPVAPVLDDVNRSNLGQ